MVPAIKAMEVITIGRRRRRHASSAASMMPFPGSPARGQTRRSEWRFTGGAHQDHQTHLHEDVVIAPGQPDAKQRGEHRHRYDKDHRQRQGPAFIQRGQYEECQQHRHREDDQRRVAWVACWKLRSVHSIFIPFGRICFDSSSRCVIACEEERTRGSASPIRSAAG